MSRTSKTPVYNHFWSAKSGQNLSSVQWKPKSFHGVCTLTCKLTHLPHCRIYASVNWVNTGSGNDLSPVRCQAITWNNAGLLSIGPLGTNFCETRIKIEKFLLMKNLSSAKCRPYGLGLNMLITVKTSQLSVAFTHTHRCWASSSILLQYRPYQTEHWPFRNQNLHRTWEFLSAGCGSCCDPCLGCHHGSHDLHRDLHGSTGLQTNTTEITGRLHLGHF